MTEESPPPGWMPTALLRWCVHTTADGRRTEAPHLEQWFDDPGNGGGAWFVIPIEVEIVE